MRMNYPPCTDDCVISHSIWTDRDWCRTHQWPVARCQECGKLFHTARPNGAKTCGDKCRKRRSRSMAAERGMSA